MSIQKITNLNSSNQKVTSKVEQLNTLIDELNTREIPNETAGKINEHIDEINAYDGADKDLLKLLRKKQSSILTLLEKDLKIVTKNYYMTRWLALGMAVFGMPFGVVFGAALDNFAFIGIGPGVGVGIGIAIGAGLDNKAKAEGRQLDVDLNY